jgi:hypothetical protein
MTEVGTDEALEVAALVKACSAAPSSSSLSVAGPDTQSPAG